MVYSLYVYPPENKMRPGCLELPMHVRRLIFEGFGKDVYI